MQDLAAKMRGIDLTMLTTHTDGGHLASRPMSNNGDVEYDGTSYFFTWEQSRMVGDIRRDPKVALELQGGADRGFLFVQVQGTADVVTSRAEMQEHWDPELSRWFQEGLDTPSLVMIRVQAERVAYWSADGDGLITL